MRFRLLLLTLLVHPLAGAGADASKGAVRVGYFPNVTHAQALVGLSSGRFQKALGEEAPIEAFAFNAGPSAVEALFAGSIDITYMGPNPAINAFVKSRGRVRVIAGACSGGSRLMIRKDSMIREAKDFAGKRLATPQLGNTQDVAARSWLSKHGLKTKDKGGTVEILPMKNPDILSLFQKKEIDAAWTVEPWATRLAHEAGAMEHVNEKSLWPKGEFATSVILVSEEFLNARPEVVRKWLAEHIEITRWINAHPDEAKSALNRQIANVEGKPLPTAILDEAFSQLKFTYDPLGSTLTSSAKAAFEQGFLGKKEPVLDGIVSPKLLNEVLAQKKLPLIP